MGWPGYEASAHFFAAFFFLTPSSSPCRLWECLAIENSNVACVCVSLLMECVHFLAHNPSPSTAAKQSPRPQHAHSVSAPVTASSTPTTAEEGEGLGGVVMGRVPGLENVENGVLWKTLHKGLTAQQWMTKFKTGTCVSHES